MRAEESKCSYNLDAVRAAIKKIIGSKVKISAISGNKTAVFYGVITGDFKSVFLFEYSLNGSTFRTSYPYVDIFTSHIKIEKTEEGNK